MHTRSTESCVHVPPSHAYTFHRVMRTRFTESCVLDLLFGIRTIWHSHYLKIMYSQLRIAGLCVHVPPRHVSMQQTALRPLSVHPRQPKWWLTAQTTAFVLSMEQWHGVSSVTCAAPPFTKTPQRMLLLRYCRVSVCARFLKAILYTKLCRYSMYACHMMHVFPCMYYSRYVTVKYVFMYYMHVCALDFFTIITFWSTRIVIGICSWCFLLGVSCIDA